MLCSTVGKPFALLSLWNNGSKNSMHYAAHGRCETPVLSLCTVLEKGGVRNPDIRSQKRTSFSLQIQSQMLFILLICNHKFYVIKIATVTLMFISGENLYFKSKPFQWFTYFNVNVSSIVYQTIFIGLQFIICFLFFTGR